LRGLIGTDSYEFRARSADLDERISDYLSLKRPEPVKPNPSPIQQRYAIYSPMCAKVMHDLLSGVIPLSEIQGQYADSKVWSLLQPQLYLLEHDPTRKTINSNYVEIHPHNYDHVVTMNVYQYTFLE